MEGQSSVAYIQSTKSMDWFYAPLYKLGLSYNDLKSFIALSPVIP
jgi:hypothetical protein